MFSRGPGRVTYHLLRAVILLSLLLQAQPTLARVAPTAPASPSQLLPAPAPQLGAAWHLLSLPELPDDPTAAAVLASLNGAYTRAYAYNACDSADPWKVYDPAAPAGANDLAFINHTFGFWVELTTPATLEVNGTPPQRTDIPLCLGWNLIGYPLAEAKPVAEALASIAGKYSLVFAYDPADTADNWAAHAVGAPAWSSDLKQLAPGHGYWIYVTEATTLSFQAPLPPPSDRPVVVLNGADEVWTITDRTTIAGTVQSSALKAWQLEYRRADEAGWTLLAQGSAPVANGPLGRFDPTLLLNGLYEIRLTGEDVAGQTSEVTAAAVVEGGLKVGHVQLSFVDLTVPVAGIPLTVIRTYDSRLKTGDDFGIGWDLAVSQGRYVHNRTPGRGWQIFPDDSFFQYPCRVVEETLAHLTEVRLSEREVYRFKLRLTGAQLIAGGCTAQASFVPVGRTDPGTKLEILGNRGVLYLNGRDEVLDDATSEVYNPQSVRLTTVDGRVIDLARGQGITRIQDANNNVLTISASGVSHSSGRGIAFTRDSAGRITRVTDPLGNFITYSYDGGDLASVTNQLGEVTQFRYVPTIPHHLDHIIGPDGKKLGNFVYGPDGRVVAICSASQHCVDMHHDLDAYTETIADATGREVRLTYDTRGNVLTRTDALGHTTTYSYDGDNNLLSERDPNGNTTSYTYDARGNRRTATLPHAPGQPTLDYTTVYTYNLRNQITAIAMPGGAGLAFAYDDDGNRTAVRDEQGNTLIAYSYSPRGQITAESDRFGSARFTYSTSGDELSSTDAYSNTLSATYDSAGRMETLTDEDNTTYNFAYDEAGRLTGANYGQGLSVAYSYNAAGIVTGTDLSIPGDMERQITPEGRLAGWIGPGGASVAFTYDEAGRLLEERDALGATTTYSYDEAGRLSGVVGPSGGATSFGLDPAGQVLSTTNALNQTSSFTYTPDGRVASTTNANGHTWRNSYVSPTETRVTDPLSRTTTLLQTAHGLPAQIVHPDGTRRTITYLTTSQLAEGEDYPTAIVDEGGHTRAYSYDQLGRLVGATDLGGARTTYGYDQGSLTLATDPTGATFQFDYNERGQVEAITYPDGSTITKAYGAIGKPVTVTLESGVQLIYAYDDAGRLSRRASLGEETRFFWNDGGQLTGVEDSAGGSTYTYDEAGALTGIRYGDGGRLLYGRDLLGRVITSSVQANLDAPIYLTSYTYDAVGNVVAVEDPSGGVTTFVYDAANRLASRTLPNGVVSSYTYNLRDQVLSVVHRSAGGAVIAALAYEREGNGEPRKITREDGSYILLDYDAALRVKEEAYHAPDGTLIETIGYTYDDAGNRLTRTSSLNGTHDYTYPVPQRLTAVTGPGGSEVYGYDADGRVTSVERDGATRTLQYDATDRLLSVADAATGAQTSYRYDGMGRRVGASNAGSSRTFVVGPTAGAGLESPHLVLDGAGALVSGYSYVGGAPLMRFGPDGPVYYLADAQGSVISLVDDEGAAVARMAYDSFGNLRQGDGQAAAGGDFRFQGAWLDGTTGFYHMRAREYDPRVGRFLSRDAAEPAPQEPESWQTYQFAYNNPQLYRDPTGMFTIAGATIAPSIQNVLQGARTAALQHMREQARDKAGELIVDVMLTFIEPLLPFDGNLLESIGKVSNSYDHGAKGDAFEQQATGIICALVPDDFLKLIWLEVPISGSGAPKENGTNCGERFDYTRLSWDGMSNPDFVVAKAPPSTHSSAYLGTKGFFIGDFKYGLKNIDSNSAQYKAIINNAQKFEHGRTALYITFSTSATMKARLRREAQAQGVNLVILSVMSVK